MYTYDRRRVSHVNHDAVQELHQVVKQFGEKLERAYNLAVTRIVRLDDRTRQDTAIAVQDILAEAQMAAHMKSKGITKVVEEEARDERSEDPTQVAKPRHA